MNDEPPKPPEIDRRLRLSRAQLIGMPLIALFPALALAGVFGEGWDHREVRGRTITLAVDFATRFRVTPKKPMIVRVDNHSNAEIDTVRVEFDSAYVEAFSPAEFNPATEDAYVVALTALKAGESRRIRVDLTAARVGRQRGRIVARVPGDSAAMQVHTFVFP
jgi:hypothetical protein